MTRKYTWDHTVDFVNDLKAAEQAFADQGLAARYGGKHVGHGTENALAYFGVNYLELLALYSKDEAAAESPENGLIFRDAAESLPEHEGFYRHGVRVNNIEERAAELHAKGIETGPIVPGNRTTADGREIRWKLLWLLKDTKAPADAPRLPFLLDWLEDEPTHTNTLESSGLLHQHPLGDVVTRRAVWQVADPKATAERLADLFEWPLTDNGDGSYNLETGDNLFWHIEATPADSDANGIVELDFQAPEGTSFDVQLTGARYRSL